MIKERPMYSIVCDHEGCEFDTQELGDYAGWGDHGAALDQWIDSECQVITIDGKQHHYCDTHRVPQCSECDGPGQPLDVHDDGFCKECATEETSQQELS